MSRTALAVVAALLLAFVAERSPRIGGGLLLILVLSMLLAGKQKGVLA